MLDRNLLRAHRKESPWPTQNELLRLLSTRIMRSQGDKRRTCLPIPISILHLLKTQLWQQTSFSLLEKYLQWAAFTLVFYSFLRASDFVTNDLWGYKSPFPTDSAVKNRPVPPWPHLDNSWVKNINMPSKSYVEICWPSARLSETWATILQWTIHATQPAQTYCSTPYPVIANRS